MNKTIPLQAVRDALMFAIVKRATESQRVARGEKPIARMAAYTRFAPLTTVTCRTPWRGRPQRDLQTGHLGFADRGSLCRVLERVRGEGGLAEVRRTWGAGLRALKAEFADGALR